MTALERMTIPQLRAALDAAEAEAARRFAAGETTVAELMRREHLGYGPVRELLVRRLGPARYARHCRANCARRPGDPRIWSDAEKQLLRRDYRRRPAAAIAADIGRPVDQVRAAAQRLGLTIPQRIGTPAFEAFLRERSAAGWSDTEIGAAWGGVCRHAVTGLRARLGLASNAYSPHVRAKIRQATREQCRREGVANLAELKAKRFRQAARRCGWPEDLRPRSVQILNALWDRGPMTRRQIADAIGMRWKGSRASLSSNDPEGSYLAHLQARGLVVRLGRFAQSRSAAGRGSRCYVYSLPPWIERSVPDARTTAASS